MIYTLGSINADYIYRVPHLPAPGETLAATHLSRELGGKGANQSVAVARAGRGVSHIGAVGQDGGWAVTALEGYGVDCTHVATVDAPTAHAIINVDPSGENAIVIFPGANREQSLTRLDMALTHAEPGDYLLLQNETNLQAEAAQLAKLKGMTVVYSAAPFAADAVQAVLDHVDILVMNAVEAAQLTAALGISAADLPVSAMIVTRGADGADWIAQGQTTHVPALPADPVDTTGAGDCFIGYTIAGLDEGLSPQDAMRLGAAASALQVQRPGTAGAIPSRADVNALLNTSR
ncbi:ribokinase [Roseovarius faecimaris]|uniref:Ribokinase n=1 Tax=Roseovarius faecimaris TaxID=2494550 RepID=A0A6I6IWZ4_9RHOB|nr:ribokinase [Roseovarius faecimaris]QGY00132.1 ribokinase [Roseovarius faecimaris]